MKLSWCDFNFNTALTTETTHIILADVAHFKERRGYYQLFLNQPELERTSHPHFILARGILKELLGYYLSVDPKTIFFDYEAKGKPKLKQHQLEFNVSHSHEKIIYIFSKKRCVGIDIEFIKREVDYLNIAKRFFSEMEFHYLNELPENQLSEAFYDLWTHKEAYVKALGVGIRAFQDFSVDLKQVPACIFPASSPWLLSTVPSIPHYRGAYAIEGGGTDVCFFQFRSK